MIARAHITEWSAHAPWPTEAQIEQDLILSRLIVEIANHEFLSAGRDSDCATIWLDADTTAGTGAIRIKVEINIAETTPHLDYLARQLAVKSAWWSGEASVRTFELEEILATKVRALCQRRKGRDLFDLWLGLDRQKADGAAVALALQHYMGERVYSYPQLRDFLSNKLDDPRFSADLGGLVAGPVAGYDPRAAAALVLERVGRNLRNVPRDAG